MALGDSYALLSELKARLSIGDTADDTALTAALAVASRGIESCCHRQFNDAGNASARLFYPDTRCRVVVDDFSTTDGLVIEIDSGSDGTFETTLDAADYELYPLNGVVDGQTGWPFWKIRTVRTYFPHRTERASIRVTARWGWTAVPAPIKEATLILAEDIFKTKDTPFGAGGYGDFGRIRARENPNVWLRIHPYVNSPILVA